MNQILKLFNIYYTMSGGLSQQLQNRKNYIFTDFHF